MSGLPPLGVGILGFGRFGRAWSELLLDQGVKVLAYDPSAKIPKSLRVDSVEALAVGSSQIFLSVPVGDVQGAALRLSPHLTSRHLVFDVASIKSEPVRALKAVLGNRFSWIATHPLFGPASVARGERPLRVVVCPNELHPKAAGRARAFYEAVGCEVILQDADAHDRLMARTHALAFFVAKGMLEAGGGEEVSFSPPSFQAMAQTIDAVRSDAGHLFYTIQTNPFAEEARERLISALSGIHKDLKGAAAAPVSHPQVFDIPPSSEKAPELEETRDLIDELDGEIVALLARRAQFAHRAARVKAAKGRSLRDIPREKAMLAKRRSWAKARELDPESVAEVFESVLRFSRGEQRRWLDRFRS